MTDQHPTITPPPELVQQWLSEFYGFPTAPGESIRHVAARAAQWSADQELEAIIAWMIKMGYWGEDGQAIPLLRAARRPKPSSLKKQALEALEDANLDAVHYNTILRALEALADD